MRILRCGFIYTHKATCTTCIINSFLISSVLFEAVHNIQDKSDVPFGSHCALRLALRRDNDVFNRKVLMILKFLHMFSDEFIQSHRAAELWLQLDRSELSPAAPQSFRLDLSFFGEPLIPSLPVA